MKFYIKVRSDETATLMTDTGVVLWTFPSVDNAQQACLEWYKINEPANCYVSGIDM